MLLCTNTQTINEFWISTTAEQTCFWISVLVVVKPESIVDFEVVAVTLTAPPEIFSSAVLTKMEGEVTSLISSSARQWNGQTEK